MAETRVITFGTFDLFHVGHLRLLQRARQQGDALVVGVSTDEMNYAKKGRYPVIPEEDRRAIIEALACVDETFWEESMEKKPDYLREHDADTLVMGNDWDGEFDHLEDIVDVVYLPRTDNISTTRIKELLSEEEAPRAQRGDLKAPGDSRSGRDPGP